MLVSVASESILTDSNCTHKRIAVCGSKVRQCVDSCYQIPLPSRDMSTAACYSVPTLIQLARTNSLIHQTIPVVQIMTHQAKLIFGYVARCVAKSWH